MSQESFFSVCDKCGREHSDGNWLICDDCAEPGLRMWLKWSIDFGDTYRVIHALAAKRLLEAA